MQNVYSVGKRIIIIIIITRIECNIVAITQVACVENLKDRNIIMQSSR